MRPCPIKEDNKTVKEFLNLKFIGSYATSAHSRHAWHPSNADVGFCRVAAVHGRRRRRGRLFIPFSTGTPCFSKPHRFAFHGLRYFGFFIIVVVRSPF